MYAWDLFDKAQILTNALAIPEIPITSIIDPTRFRAETKLNFKTQRGKKIWQQLEELKI